MDASASPTPRFVPPPGTLTPTDEQQALQLAQQSTILVEAHAGAAKTTTLALRLAEAWRGGAAPGDCLVLTATEAACTAMRQALQRIGLPVAVARAFRIATFDGFAAGVLRAIEGAEVPVLRTPELLKPRVWEAVDLLQQREDDRWREDLVLPALGDNGFVATFLQRMLWLKGTLLLEREGPEGALTPDDAAELGQDYTQLRVLHLYERQVRRGGHPDHPAFRGPSDATYDLARHLRDAARGEADAFPAAWPQRLRVLLVDEMHDMNEAMATVLLHLLRDTRCLFCGVGDVHQVIHSASGADPAFLRGRIGDDSGRRVARYRLGASFRFDAQLARRAGRFTAQQIASLTAHTTTVGVQAYAGEDACVSQVLAGVQALRKARRKLDGIAILLRHEHHSIALENALVEAGLPYRMAGFESYLLRPEVLLVRGLLAIATRDFASLRQRDTLARMVEAFVFFCGTRLEDDPEQPEAGQAELLATAIGHLHDNSENLPLFLQNHVLRTAEPGVRRRLQAAMAVAQAGGEPGLLPRVAAALDMPWFIAQALVQPERRQAALRNLEGLLHLGQGFATAAAFFARLNEAEEKLAARKPTAAPTLASVAAVKGLEFDHVLLPFLRQGDFPSDQGLPGDEDNLFYVAITRARMSLGLFVDVERPSTFLARMGAKVPGLAAA